MTITSILLQFHLQISLIARINHFSGCSHCLEASQVVCDVNRLTGFFVMAISFEGSSWAICKIVFFVNGILLLLPVLRLALIFLIFMVYLVFFTFYCFSILVCANLVAARVFLTIFFVYWKNTCFQRCRLIWSSIMGRIFNSQTLFSIWSIKFSLC